MKKLVTNYTFDASAQTITSTDFSILEGVLLITNVTDNVIIYNFAASGLGGSLTTNVLTLDYNTTSMSDTDDLQIFYEEKQTPLNDYGQDDAVVYQVTTDILTYTVPANQTLQIQGFRVSGSATGLFRLKVNGVVVATARTSAAERTVTADFGAGTISAATGLDVVVTAYHSETPNQSMDANVFGLLV